jgi:hypothetical protein
MAKNNNGKNGFFSQLKSIYTFTQKRVKLLPLILIAMFVVVLGIGAIVVVLFSMWMLIPLFVMLAVFGPLVTMAQMGNHIAMKEIEGKPGATVAILSSVKTKAWVFSDEPVAVNQKSMDLVFRGIGKPGILFVSEGTTGRVIQMLQKETQKAKRYAPNVPIHTIQVGSRNGQIPMKKLRSQIRKLKSVLTRAEVEQLQKRLIAIGAFKPPIPKGIDPMNKGTLKGNKKALRGK